MKWILILIFLIVNFESLKAQTADSVQKTKPKWAILLKLDTRKTFIADNQVGVLGLQMGVRRNRIKYWLGVATIQTQNRLLRRNIQQGDRKPTIPEERTLNLVFGTLGIEYIFLNTKYLDLSIPIEAGFGTADLQITRDGLPLRDRKGTFVPLEGGLYVLAKPTRWFGINGSFGYRKSLNITGFEGDYDGVYYSYGVSVFLGPIYKDWKAWRNQKTQN
jgi:hypothetical protein